MLKLEISKFKIDLLLILLFCLVPIFIDGVLRGGAS